MGNEAVLIDGRWREAAATGTFQAENPAEKRLLPAIYPVSDWADCDAALAAAAKAAKELRTVEPNRLAGMLEDFAQRLADDANRIVDLAHLETGLPKTPRLAEAELPRTIDQLQKAAAAAREGTWASPTIDTKAGIRSYFAPIGPVCVFGPNNFPFAYNGAAGGDFAAAIATGNPVIAKANSSHPGTTKLLAEHAFAAVQAAQLPAATVQLIYRTSHEHGERLVSDPRNGAVGYTGSRSAGLKLKDACDRAGKPAYLELSSVNPVVLLPGALAQRCDDLVTQFTASCLMGAGQFCTNPGLILLIAGEATSRFIAATVEKFQAATPGTLLSRSVFSSLAKSIEILTAAGAKRLTGDQPSDESRYCRANTLLHVSGAKFLADPHVFQTEAFGNSSLYVEAQDINEAIAILERLEGNLTGSIYSSSDATDDEAYALTAAALRPRVGRLLNDKMPTGVAVSAAMNHGGPFPATGHPAFTAVGVPASLKRFVMLECFDNVREHRLPALLRNRNPSNAWRYIDGRYTQDDVA